jgi:hypothetical protein
MLAAFHRQLPGHAESSTCLKTADAADGISFLWALLNERRIEEQQLGGQR